MAASSSLAPGAALYNDIRTLPRYFPRPSTLSTYSPRPGSVWSGVRATFPTVVGRVVVRAANRSAGRSPSASWKTATVPARAWSSGACWVARNRSRTRSSGRPSSRATRTRCGPDTATTVPGAAANGRSQRPAGGRGQQSGQGRRRGQAGGTPRQSAGQGAGGPGGAEGGGQADTEVDRVEVAPGDVGAARRLQPEQHQQADGDRRQAGQPRPRPAAQQPDHPEGGQGQQQRRGRPAAADHGRPLGRGDRVPAGDQVGVALRHPQRVQRIAGEQPVVAEPQQRRGQRRQQPQRPPLPPAAPGGHAEGGGQDGQQPGLAAGQPGGGPPPRAGGGPPPAPPAPASRG